MAKLRTNHARQGGRGGGNIIRVVLFAAILGGFFMLFSLLLDRPGSSTTTDPYDGDRAFMLPGATGGQVIHHRFFTLSYAEKHEQAEWVAYVLSSEELAKPWVDRSETFTIDPEVSTGSATLEDYRGSGFDRGHLVPAADRAFSREAIRETFYLSNITPQDHHFNGGIWRELEETTREWARKNKRLYIVTGPVLKGPALGKIGANEVTVPSAFYKVILDLTEPQRKGIAFIIPNAASNEPLKNYAVPIDEVEELTGIDFFPELLHDDLEEQLESMIKLEWWPFYPKKYELRVQKWNNQ